jgi:predicted TIM-barrel fold metal-dependent hydrolase
MHLPPSLVVSPERIAAMDEQGIDIEALSINPIFWYKAERELAGQVVKLQNEKLAEICATQPDRFVGLASVALQHPDLAAEQLEDAVKRLGLRGALIGGSVEGQELSDPKFHPFWAKAEQLEVLIFIHPQGTAELNAAGRLKGNGGLDNVIGNPLETTIALSHLIFEGTLDAFPGLKICAAHAGGYLPSYAARSDRGCETFPQRCTITLKKRRSEYRGSCTTTRWCSRRRDCVIWPPKSAPARSSWGQTTRSPGPGPRSTTAPLQRCRARRDARRDRRKAPGDQTRLANFLMRY